MSDSSRLNRRSVLKGLGATGLAAGAGGLGILATTGGAAAQAALDITINDAKVSNDRGEVDYVGVNLDKTITWDGFDVPVKYIGFKHEVATDANSKGWHTLYGEKVSAELPDWSNYGDDESVDTYTTDESDKPDGTKGTATAGVQWEIINGSGNPGQYAGFGYDGNGPQDPAAWASDLSVAEDGTVQTHQVRWKTTLYFYEGTDADGNYVQVSEDDGVPSLSGEERFDVTVTNETAELTGSETSGNSVAQ